MGIVLSHLDQAAFRKDVDGRTVFFPRAGSPGVVVPDEQTKLRIQSILGQSAMAANAALVGAPLLLIWLAGSPVAWPAVTWCVAIGAPFSARELMLRRLEPIVRSLPRSSLGIISPSVMSELRHRDLGRLWWLQAATTGLLAALLGWMAWHIESSASRVLVGLVAGVLILSVLRSIGSRVRRQRV